MKSYVFISVVLQGSVLLDPQDLTIVELEKRWTSNWVNGEDSFRRRPRTAPFYSGPYTYSEARCRLRTVSRPRSNRRTDPWYSIRIPPLGPVPGALTHPEGRRTSRLVYPTQRKWRYFHRLSPLLWSFPRLSEGSSGNGLLTVGCTTIRTRTLRLWRQGR